MNVLSRMESHPYSFEKTGPDTVRVRMEETSYPLSRKEILEGIEKLEGNGAEKARDPFWQERLNFYQEALDVLDGVQP